MAQTLVTNCHLTRTNMKLIPKLVGGYWTIPTRIFQICSPQSDKDHEVDTTWAPLVRFLAFLEPIMITRQRWQMCADVVEPLHVKTRSVPSEKASLTNHSSCSTCNMPQYAIKEQKKTRPNFAGTDFEWCSQTHFDSASFTFLYYNMMRTISDNRRKVSKSNFQIPISISMRQRKCQKICVEISNI